MALITPAIQPTPTQLARAQIEQELVSSLTTTLALRKRVVQSLLHSETGSTAPQIVAEFGADWALFVDHFQKEQAAALVIDPSLQPYFDQEALDVAAAFS